MGDISHSGSGDHNPADHHDGTRVHLWGHKSPITADHTTYNFEQDPDLVVEIDIPINKRITSAGNKRVLSASAISGSGTERSYRSTNSGVGRPPIKSRSRPMKPHEVKLHQLNYLVVVYTLSVGGGGATLQIILNEYRMYRRHIE